MLLGGLQAVLEVQDQALEDRRLEGQTLEDPQALVEDPQEGHIGENHKEEQILGNHPDPIREDPREGGR